MWKIRISLAFFLILVLVSVSGAQTAPKAPPPTSGPDIITSLGKITLDAGEKKCPGWHRDPGDRTSRAPA